MTTPGNPAAAPPTGFTLSQRSSNLLNLLGPLYEAGAGADYRIGLRIDERHSNRRGFCHGAVLAMLADVHLGRLCALVSERGHSFVTSGLTLAYLAPARPGAWLEAEGEVDRVGRSLAHASGRVLADGKPVLRAVGAFQLRAG